MKKLMIAFLLCLALVPAMAQQKSDILVYKVDGTIDTLLLNNVREMYHSRQDTLGVEHADLMTLRFRLLSGERAYALSDIDHVVMPRFGRVISFLGTNTNNKANGPRRTSVHGDFPGSLGDKVNYSWTNGDKIYLGSGAVSERLYRNYDNAVFQFRSDSLIADRYVVYYPGQNATAYNKVTIPTVQQQTKANNSDHLGLSGDCGTAVATRSEASSRKDTPEYTFTLDHKTAVICFLPHVDTLRTIVLKQIGVKANKTIAGEYTLSPSGITLNDGTGSDSIMLNTGFDPEKPVANAGFPIPQIKGTSAAQDSVASYMVVAPQDSKTSLTVYYRVYDTRSGMDTTVVKKISYARLNGATVYTATNNIPVRIFLSAFTDSVQWDFGKPATLYGSVNLPVKNVGFIWGYNRDLNEQTKEQDLPMTYSAPSFSHLATDNVAQRAYYYRAYANDGKRTVWGKIKKFGMERMAVDLGLSVKWSNINLGAITAEDDGDYYAWAELTPKTTFYPSNYKYYQNNAYLPLPADISGNPVYDAATATWGGCWRMPTRDEYNELVNKGSWESKVNEGKNVWKVSANNDSILIPKSGYHWHDRLYDYGNDSFNWTASNYDYDDAYRANQTWMGYYGKFYGTSIRPVFDSNIETVKGQYLFIRTDSIGYGADRTTLMGTMRGLDDVVKPITEGFVVGTAEAVTLDADTKVLNTEASAVQNGPYSLDLLGEELDKLALGTAYYVRAYLTFDGNTYYGKALKMDAVTIKTDSTSWQVGLSTGNLYGAATGITKDGAKNIELGFVVGTTEDVTVGNATKELVCDSTVNGRFACTLTDIPMQQLYYRAFIRRGGSIVYGDPMMLGLEMVDLGLPSGTLWANINVGAQSPVDFGEYYAWGETKTKKEYTRSNYDPKNAGGSVWDNIGLDISGTIYDAAQMNWAGAWVMPTNKQQQELFNNCDVTWTTKFGVNGYLFTSKINGKSIFLPAAGASITSYKGKACYASSNVADNNTASEFMLAMPWGVTYKDTYWHFDDDHNGYSWRWDGWSIRPVIRYNMTLADDSKILFSTDSVRWAPGETSATLYGYLLGLRANNNATESGFIVGTSQNLKIGDTGAQTLVYPTVGDDHVANGVYSCTLTDVKDNTTYYYKAYVRVGDTYYYGEEHEFGREWVDLGLSSHTLWASINIGTGSIEQQGDRYAWGETTPRTSFTKAEYTATDAKGDIAGSNYDAAHKAWGGLSRMPSAADIEELVGSQCSWTEVTRYGQQMYKVTGPNGRSIYLLKAQTFWSSTLNERSTSDNSDAYAATTNGSHDLASEARYSGNYLRAVIHTNATLADDVKAYVTTDSCNWQVGLSEVRLHGTISTSAAVSTLERGFLVGYNADLTAGGKDVTELTATASTTDDSFTSTIDYKKDTTYYYRAFIKQNGTYHYGDVRRYGLEIVDMGNGLKWASINIGAQYDADLGSRFAWAETQTKSSYTEQTYKYYDGGKYQTLRADISASSYDAAHKQWGGDWRMPTLMEMQTLVDSCTWTWITVDGQPGYTVKAKNGNSIFLPAAGYQDGSYYKQLDAEADYWTSSIASDDTANSLQATSAARSASNVVNRFRGLSIRPVLTIGGTTGEAGGITGGHKQGGSTGTGSEGTGGGNSGTGNNGGAVGD